MPMGETWRDVIAEIADKSPRGSDLSNRRLIVEKVFGLARRGVPWAIQFLVERLEGKPPQALLVANANGNALSRLSDAQLSQLIGETEGGFLTHEPSTKPESRSDTGSNPRKRSDRNDH